jgi:hypothetical protein
MHTNMHTKNHNQKVSHESSHEGLRALSKSSETALAWTAPLRRKMQKGKIWMMGAAAVVLLLLFYGSATGNWIFIIAIITAVIVYALDHFEQTRTINIEISEFGVKIGNSEIPWSNIKSFWIVYDQPFVRMLHIRTTGRAMPDIGIDLDSQDPVEIRRFMKRHVTELEGKKESFLDLSTRLLKL